MLGVIVESKIYEVDVECPCCEQTRTKEVYSEEALEAYLDYPVDICPDCEHLVTLHTEEEWDRLLAEMFQ
jgi:hypothetical protein